MRYGLSHVKMRFEFTGFEMEKEQTLQNTIAALKMNVFFKKLKCIGPVKDIACLTYSRR